MNIVGTAASSDIRLTEFVLMAFYREEQRGDIHPFVKFGLIPRFVAFWYSKLHGTNDV